MSYFEPERQAELHRQRILMEAQEIHLQNEALSEDNAASKVLTRLGEWMVSRGERLRRKNSTSHVYYTELNKKIIHR